MSDDDQEKVILDKKEQELNSNPEFRTWLQKAKAQVALLSLLESVTA